MNVEELYQEIIVDHSKHPRNEGADAQASHKGEGVNPLCGDMVRLFVRIQDGRIEKISFEGEGCAISRASASLLTELFKGKTVAEAEKLIAELRQVLLESVEPSSALGEAGFLSRVRRFPTRIQCALLPWNTLRDALQKR